MKIYVVRHGQTDWNVKNLLQGSTDVELNEVGINQAFQTFSNLSSTVFDAIYSSPLKRALKTAEIINQNADLPIITDNRLAEREFGNFEGLPGMEVNFKKYWDYELNAQDNNVESIHIFYNRIKDFLQDIIKKYGNTDKNILIVTHNGVNLAIDSLLNGIPKNIFSLNLSPCNYKVFTNPKLQNNQIKFSIIIPAYNTEKYVDSTLNSIFNQTYKNYEIIVVDDCSTDNTYNLLKKYKNIRLLRTNINSRQGGARNIGLDACRGEYVLFLDSDDTLYENTSLENIYNCINQNQKPDIIYTGMKISGKRNMEILPTEDNCEKNYRLSEYKWANVVSICWKNALIQSNNLRFPEKIRYEDVYFYFLGIEKAKTFAIGNFIVYNYNNRNSSTTTSYSLDQVKDTITIIEKLYSLKDIIHLNSIPLLKKRIEQQASRVPIRLERAIKQMLDN